MSKDDVLQRYLIPIHPSGSDPTIAGFAEAHMRAVAAGAIRKAAAGVGHDIPAVKLTDPTVLDRITAEAQRQAVSIPGVTNRILTNAVGRMPDNLTDAQYQQRLAPVRDSIRAYSSDVLIPGSADLAANTATGQFYKQNAIASTWTIERTSGLSTPDDCQEAVDKGTFTQDEIADVVVPFHPNCSCLKVRTSIDESTVPDTLSFTG